MKSSRFLCALLLALAFTDTAFADPLPIHISEADGFVDVDIPIERLSQDGGLLRILARGQTDTGPIGIEVDFPIARNLSQAEGVPVSIGSARIVSLGADSDRFVAFLAKRYGVEPAPTRMLKRVDATTAGLGDEGSNALTGLKQTKFFFYDNGPEDRYAELFVNVDFDGHTLQVYEKDPDYRKGVILALTKGP